MVEVTVRKEEQLLPLLLLASSLVQTGEAIIHDVEQASVLSLLRISSRRRDNA